MRNTKTAAFYVGKGGVGKTTSAAHMGVAAAREHGLDVVLIDLSGTQNDLATQFGLGDSIEDPDAPISAVFGDDWDFIAENIPDIVDRMVYETAEGPDLIPSDSGLSGADNNLASAPVEERYLKLAEFVETHLTDRYDLVIFDLPGKEDNVSLNGIFAAEHIVTPLCPGKFERRQLENLREDLESIRDELADVLDTRDVHPHLAMVIPTMITARTKQSADFVEEIEAAYPEAAAEPVAKSQNISNLQGQGKTLFAATDDELYATGKRARDAYRTNTATLLEAISHD
ncbi:ParA family protein [Halosimplex carlsbadense]|nr:ParA family protein [Halosimplex carlsbadense]